MPTRPPARPADDRPPRRPGVQRRQRVQAAETGMALLKGLARLGGRASLTALAAELGEPPAKVHRYLVSGVEAGLVAQDPASQQYLLGPEAIQIGLAALRQADPLRAAEPALRQLRDTLGVTCFLAVMGNKGPTIVRMEEPGLPVTVNVRVGSVLSLLWSATGRAFLGLLDDPRVQALAEAEWRDTPAAQRPPDDPAGAARDAGAAIAALRATVRAQGLTSVRDTYLRGISAVAAPVHDHAGRVCAVLTALGASGGFDPAPAGPVARALCREAAAASRLLGHAAHAGVTLIPESDKQST